jgi:ribonuclease Z
MWPDAALGYVVDMRPRFFPSFVNDRFGDPVVYVDFSMERRAVLFDLGRIDALSTRSVLQLSDVFISHAHIDHFIGFDHLLRLFVGREKRLRFYGPAGFTDRVEAKLNAYTWNLSDRYSANLVFSVTEAHGDGSGCCAEFSLKNRFKREAEREVTFAGGVLLEEPSLTVTYADLEHRTPCLAFAIEEKEHVNIWKNRLDALGLAVGPWLNELRAAVYEKRSDETLIDVQRVSSGRTRRPLGDLRRKVVSATPGQKIAYVTDAAHSPQNVDAIIRLAKGADILVIEAVFTDADESRAEERAHLTASQAGGIARKAGVKRLEPFHFSPRYAPDETILLREAEDAFGGGACLEGGFSKRGMHQNGR